MKSKFTHSVLLFCLGMLCSVSAVRAQTIAPGFGFTLFACANGSVSVTGINNYGQLGTGNTTTERRTVALLSSISGVSDLSAGGTHSLFLKNDGTVWVCGRNLFGQLGDGTNVNKNIPTMLTSLDHIISVKAGDNYSMFLKNDGTVWGCGANISGSIGDGTNTARNTPVQVKNISGIIAISTGFAHTLFLKNDGTVWACGVNQKGELGLGTQTTMQTTPLQIPGLTDITSVSASSTHSLFLKKDGTVWACGDNKYGALGDNTSVLKSTPIQISGLSNITAVSAGSYFSLFLKNDGTVWGCGVNVSGELGQGTAIAKFLAPVQITTGVKAIFAGSGSNSFFLETDNSMWATGYNTTGELGDGSDSTVGKVVSVKNQCSTATLAETLTDQPEILVYPNPNSGSFHLKIQHVPNDSRVEIFNLVAEKMYDQTIHSNTVSLDLENYPKGLYFYKLAGQNHLLASGKIVVN